VAPTSVRVQLPGPLDAEFAGLVAAQALGYYDDEHLKVQLVPGTGSASAVQAATASSGPEFAIANVPDLLAAREHGSDLMDIAQVFQRSGTIVMALNPNAPVASPSPVPPPLSSPVSSPGSSATPAPSPAPASMCDLKGKRIGVWATPADLEVTAALSGCSLSAGSGYTKVQVPMDATALLNGNVDASEAEIYDQYAQVLEAINPKTNQQYTTDELITYSPEDQQSNVLQDAILARSAWLKATGNSDVAAGFLRAVVKGWVYCRDHQEDCVQFVVKAGTNLGTTHQRWMLNEVNALIWPAADGIGNVDAVQWQRTIDVTLNAGLITKRPDTSAFDGSYLQSATGELVVGGTDLQASDFQKLVVAVAPGGK
jgi:NitT/TauT family transport system substrate-binding protein